MRPSAAAGVPGLDTEAVIFQLEALLDEIISAFVTAGDQRLPETMLRIARYLLLMVVFRAVEGRRTRGRGRHEPPPAVPPSWRTR
jgi:hypothetical protein